MASAPEKGGDPQSGGTIGNCLSYNLCYAIRRKAK